MSLSDTITDILDDGKGRITLIFGRGKARDMQQPIRPGFSSPLPPTLISVSRAPYCPYAGQCASGDYGSRHTCKEYEDCHIYYDYASSTEHPGASIHEYLGIPRMKDTP